MAFTQPTSAMVTWATRLLKLRGRDIGSLVLDTGTFAGHMFSKVYDEHPDYVIWCLTTLKNEGGQPLCTFMDYCQERIANEEARTVERKEFLENRCRLLQATVQTLQQRVSALEVAQGGETG